jgi:lantibiotic transport system permease protein
MVALTRALHAETLKLNRTLALLVAVALPMVVVLINFFMFARIHNIPGGDDAWGYFLNNNLIIWAILMMPLYITLETALLAGLEHSNQGWKHLFALPLPRAAIYASKQIVACGMAALSLVVLVLGAWGSAELGRALNMHPESFGSVGFDWTLALQTAGLIYLLSLGIITIHTWIALRFPNFALASAVGIAATIMSFLINNDKTVRSIFPWTLSTAAFSLQGESLDFAGPLAISLIVALLVSVIGGWDVIRKDVL